MMKGDGNGVIVSGHGGSSSIEGSGCSGPLSLMVKAAVVLFR